MTNYTLTVPVKFIKDGKEQTAFRRVGAVFENTKNGTSETSSWTSRLASLSS